MTAYLLANHLLNFMAPAAFVALLLVSMARLFARFFRAKSAKSTGFIAQIATVFIVNVLVLVAGLLLFGHDGMMLSYGAMVLLAATTQWVLWRGWKA